MKKEFNTLKLINTKAHIYKTWLTAVHESQSSQPNPTGETINFWRFNSSCQFKTYKLPWNEYSNTPILRTLVYSQ